MGKESPGSLPDSQTSTVAVGSLVQSGSPVSGESQRHGDGLVEITGSH